MNRSIGAQWRFRIDELESQILEMTKHMSEEQKKSVYLNVELIYD